MAENEKKLHTYRIQLPPGGSHEWPSLINIDADELVETEYGVEFKRDGVLVGRSISPAAWWVDAESQAD